MPAHLIEDRSLDGEDAPILAACVFSTLNIAFVPGWALTATLTTIADDSSLQRFEAGTGLPASKDLPSSLVQLRIAVWTGDTRDTRPTPVIGMHSRNGELRGIRSDSST